MKDVDVLLDRIRSIQNETRRYSTGNGQAQGLSTIGAMCEVILNPDFATAIGVEPFVPQRDVDFAILTRKFDSLMEYADHKDACASNECTQCDGSIRIGYSHSGTQHDFQPKDCDCGLIELLGAVTLDAS